MAVRREDGSRGCGQPSPATKCKGNGGRGSGSGGSRGFGVIEGMLATCLTERRHLVTWFGVVLLRREDGTQGEGLGARQGQSRRGRRMYILREKEKIFMYMNWRSAWNVLSAK